MGLAPKRNRIKLKSLKVENKFFMIPIGQSNISAIANYTIDSYGTQGVS